ncbi:MAG: M13 family metallopeptidase [Novosphingobium sp.]|nr:M13 family metallopeptidase [Novosphingobium sp.]
MNRLIAALAAAASLSTIASASAQTPAAAIPTDEYRLPDFPGWGVNPADLDRARDPGDDFFAYVNGRWIANEVIPAQYAYSGNALGLRLGAERNIRTIVEEMAAGNFPVGSLERRIGDAYRAFLDTSAINAAGLAPAKPYLDQIAAVKTRADLARAFAAPGIPAPLGAFVSIDRTNPELNALYTGVGGLGLPDRDYYLVDNEKNLAIRAKYKDYLAFLLGLAQVPSLFVAQVPPTQDEITKIGLTPEQLKKLGGGMPAMLALLNTAPIEDIKAWTAARFLSSHSAVLPSDIDDANFDFYGKTLQGRTQQRARWQRAISFVEGTMGEALGKIYVERHFPASSKTAMEELVGNLRLALAANLKDLPWMTPATRVAAQKKLDAFRVKIGYPEKFETYEGLVVTPGQALANNVSAGEWAWDDQLRELAEPVDKAKWLMTPQTVNAYYMPPANEIVFPAAFLQPPNFNPNADPAVNYGAVGVVIGHEIGHGFDDQGSKYGPTGALENWWTDEDRKTFDALGAKLAAQYDKVCPYDEGKTCHSGKLTLGENIGDLGGLSMAYQAYKLSLKGKPAPVIDGLTGDQRFFIGYAQAWRWKYREAFGRQLLQTDTHSLAEARVNAVVRNFDPWYKAFDVTPDDAMWLDPKDRVRIW